MEIRDISCTDDLADRFPRMQREEATQGRLIKLPRALTNGVLDQLRILHREQWEECERQRIALGA